MKKGIVFIMLTFFCTGLFAERHVVGLKARDINLGGINMIVVSDLVMDSPAMRAGLRVGDWIVELDGRDMVGRTFQDLASSLSGDEPKEQVLKVRRGPETVDIPLSRVPYSQLSGKGLLFGDDEAITMDGAFLSPVFSVDYTPPKLDVSQADLSFSPVEKQIQMTLCADDNLSGEMWVQCYIYQKSDRAVIANRDFLLFRKPGYTNLIYIGEPAFALREGKITGGFYVLEPEKIDPADLRLGVILRDSAGNRSFYTLKQK